MRLIQPDRRLRLCPPPAMRQACHKEQPMQTTTPLTHSALHIIHKYIRAQLFEMANALARADNQDLAEVQRQLENTAALLRGHGSHEDQAFESVLRAYDPLLANTLEDDHLKLEAALQRILTSAGQ